MDTARLPMVIRTYRGYQLIDNCIGTVFIVFSGEIITEVQSLPEAHSIIDYWLYAY